MSETIDITISLDRNIKENAEQMFNGLGMNLSTAINVFVYQSLKQGKIPFEISDPFYSERNQKRLRQSIAHADAGLLTEHDMVED